MTFRISTIASTSLIALTLNLPAKAVSHNEMPALEIMPKNMVVTGSDGVSLNAFALEQFENPWAMTFLPDGQALVTEKAGAIWLLNAEGTKKAQIANTPEATARGQGGLGDIIIHPDFAENGIVFLSYVERDAEDDTLSGAAVEKATLTLTETGGELSDRIIIWRQSQKVTGNGHYGHRLAIAPDGNLIITSSDRQKFSPAQNMDMSLGKIIRVNTDGEPLEDNPFYGSGGVTDSIWSLGHRNMLGIDFDARGQLWVHEMGPKGGDELNRIIKGENYGYPIVSDGVHYNGKAFFGTHEDFPIYENPAFSWTPVISPSGLVIYDGEAFPDWQGDAFIGGLSSQALIRVEFTGSPLDNQGSGGASSTAETTVNEAARYEWDQRIREVEQGPDGMIYVLEDQRNGKGGRLIKLMPQSTE